MAERKQWKLEDVSNTSLDEDDLFDIIKDLTPVAARWKAIGVALRLKYGVLDSINPGRPDECLFDVIANWLKRNYNVDRFGPPTWRKLVEIVADPAAGNDTALADKIARKHLTKKEDDPAPPSYASSISLYKDPPAPTTPLAQADVSTYVEEPWYHGDISFDVAEERLTALDSDNFLVRKSQSQPGKYVLSVSYGKAMKHFMIRKENQCYQVEGAERIFSSLQELVAFYNVHYLTTDWELLSTPCPPQRLKPRQPRPSPISVQDIPTTMKPDKATPLVPKGPLRYPIPVPRTSSPKRTSRPDSQSTSYLPPSPPDSPIQRTQESIVVDSPDNDNSHVVSREPQPPRPDPSCPRPKPKPRRPRTHRSHDQTNSEGDTLSGLANLSISAGSSQFDTSSDSNISHDTRQ